jgi:predicted ATPase
LAVNEPETSLHPDILDALTHLIVRAVKNVQLWITTHSQPLVAQPFLLALFTLSLEGSLPKGLCILRASGLP